MKYRSFLLVVPLALLALVPAACDHSGDAQPATAPAGPSAAPGTATGGSAALIAAARRSNDLYSIFPLRASTKSCGIPHGGPITVPNRPIRGTCSTRILYDRGGRTTVLFTQRWRSSGSAPPVLHHHTWHVIVSDGRKVLGTHSSGDIPPQLWL